MTAAPMICSCCTTMCHWGHVLRIVTKELHHYVNPRVYLDGWVSSYKGPLIKGPRFWSRDLLKQDTHVATAGVTCYTASQQTFFKYEVYNLNSGWGLCIQLHRWDLCHSSRLVDPFSPLAKQQITLNLNDGSNITKAGLKTNRQTNKNKEIIKK